MVFCNSGLGGLDGLGWWHGGDEVRITLSHLQVSSHPLRGLSSVSCLQMRRIAVQVSLEALLLWWSCPSKPAIGRWPSQTPPPRTCPTDEHTKKHWSIQLAIHTLVKFATKHMDQVSKYVHLFITRFFWWLERLQRWPQGSFHSPDCSNKFPQLGRLQRACVVRPRQISTQGYVPFQDPGPTGGSGHTYVDAFLVAWVTDVCSRKNLRTRGSDW